MFKRAFIAILFLTTTTQVSAQSLFEVRTFDYDRKSQGNTYKLPGNLNADWHCTLSSVGFSDVMQDKGTRTMTVWLHNGLWHVDGTGKGRRATVRCLHLKNRPAHPLLTSDFVPLEVPFPMFGLSPVITRFNFQTNLRKTDLWAIESYGKYLCGKTNKQLDTTAYFSPEIGRFQFATDDRYGHLSKYGSTTNQVLAKHPNVNVVSLTHVKCK